jgi:hypothetical protein
MNEAEIKQLLERYWQCETSPEEEQALRSYFVERNLSGEEKIYQPLFRWVHQLSGIQASKELINKTKEPVRISLYPFLKVAASVLIAVSIGVGVFTHYQQEKQLDKLFSDTYTNPEDAVQKTEQIIAKVSLALQLMQEQQIQEGLLDSLQIKELQHETE